MRFSIACLRGFGDLGPAVADVDAPETGAAVDQLAPLVVLDAHAPAALDDQRPVAHVGGDRGERMEQALPVHLLERVVRFLLEHSLPPLEPRDGAVGPPRAPEVNHRRAEVARGPEGPTGRPVKPSSTIGAFFRLPFCVLHGCPPRPRQPRQSPLTQNPRRKGSRLTPHRLPAWPSSEIRATTKVSRRSRSTGPGLERAPARRTLVESERAVRPLAVVALPPGLHDARGLGARAEPVLAQALVPKPANETRHERVLDRLARRDARASASSSLLNRAPDQSTQYFLYSP